MLFAAFDALFHAPPYGPGVLRCGVVVGFCFYITIFLDSILGILFYINIIAFCRETTTSQRRHASCVAFRQ